LDTFHQESFVMIAKSPRKKRTSLPGTKVEKIGQAAVRLHRLLKELGHTRNLEKSASTMPDARDRLSFIDKSMHEASEKTISAVEVSIPLIKGNRAACSDMSIRLSDTNFGKHSKLVEDTITQLGEIAAAEERVHHNLMQIMEAQEFRDVAGQMVNKIVLAAVEVENILLDLLKEYAPDAKDSLISAHGLTSGPSVKAEDNVNGQDEVDDLLASMGF
jgi:chemotaxis protein CheZ